MTGSPVDELDSDACTLCFNIRCEVSVRYFAGSIDFVLDAEPVGWRYPSNAGRTNLRISEHLTRYSDFWCLSRNIGYAITT